MFYSRIIFGTMLLLSSSSFSFYNRGMVSGIQRQIQRRQLTMKKQHTTITTKSLSPKYRAKTENQRKYVELLNDKKTSLIVALGPAGSGKTLLACVNAIEMLQKGEIQKIILTRPMITVEDEEVGFLPGNLVAKMDPWTKPMFDIFTEYYSMQDMIGMIHSGKIEVCPLAYMRGRTFHKSFIIADEMQNSSPTQILMLSTRLGEKSKMVIMGDLQQSDSKNRMNGLSDFLDKYNKRVEHEIHGIGMVKLEREDILRSNIVSQILKLYYKEEDGGAREASPEEKKPTNNDCALIPKDLFKNI
jgi:phosphate starvation-inducible PhoH-like protein